MKKRYILSLLSQIFPILMKYKINKKDREKISEIILLISDEIYPDK
jgi:hypothetical protein